LTWPQYIYATIIPKQRQQEGCGALDSQQVYYYWTTFVGEKFQNKDEFFSANDLLMGFKNVKSLHVTNQKGKRKALAFLCRLAKDCAPKVRRSIC
jgi:hypothetical protein